MLIILRLKMVRGWFVNLYMNMTLYYRYLSVSMYFVTLINKIRDL